ncbi:hypothetical protein WJX81_007083 [Elliptochloris bilobata]|uniref:Uncharacterized protein n=1 Tax=Elliptochloris bilobata TaxID=381761 RepID=A0AAW1QLW1_9CHLO
MPPGGDETGGGPDRSAKPVASASVSGINYYGGPLMVQNPVNIYYIWYGKWAGNSGVPLLTALAKNMGSSSWYRIISSYFQLNGATKTFVPTWGAVPALRYSNATFDSAYSQGKSLSDEAVGRIVTAAINSGAFGRPDPNGIYFVLTTPDVTATSGFCTQYCAWHTYGMVRGVAIKCSFVGSGLRCPSACAPFSPSPNGNVGADAMASTLSHELVETVTDPTFTGWYDSQGYENADKCAWTFGQTYKIFTGAMYNVIIGPNAFMIQRNWLNVGAGSCVTTY